MPTTNSMAVDPLSLSPIYEDQKKLERKKAIIQAMMGQQGPQVPLQYYGPLNALSDVLSKGAAAYGMGKIGEQEADLNRRYREGGVAAWDQFADKLKGGNRDELVKALMALSPYKEQYELGSKLVDKHYPSADVKSIDGNLVETGPGAPKPLGYAGQTYSNLPTLPGGAPVQVSNQSGEKKYGPQTPVGPFTGAGQNEIVKKNIAWLDENRGKVIESPQRMQELAKASRLISEGVVKGNLAPVGQFLAQMGHSLGTELSPENANLETIRSTLAPLVLERVRALAPVTNIDMEKVEQMVGSDPTKMTDEALVQLLNTFAWQTENFGNEYNRINKVNSQLMTGPASPELLQSAFPKFTPPDFGSMGAGAGAGAGASGTAGQPKRYRLNADGTLEPVQPGPQ
jgi:hypothetical protein